MEEDTVPKSGKGSAKKNRKPQSCHPTPDNPHEFSMQQQHQQQQQPQQQQPQHFRHQQPHVQNQQPRENHQQHKHPKSKFQNRDAVNQKPNQVSRKFEPYWSAGDVEEGLKNKTLIEGPIRVNPKNYEDAFIPDPAGKHQIHINFIDRNRALNTDVVLVKLKEKKEWIVQLDEIKDLLLKDTHQFHPFLKDELSRVIEKSEQADYNVEDAAIPECSKLPSHNPPSDSATGSSPSAPLPESTPLSIPTPTHNAVREQLPPEIRQLVDAMEKSWKEENKGQPQNKPQSNNQRKNHAKPNSVSANALSCLFKDVLNTEAGKTLLTMFPDDLLQKTAAVVSIVRPVHTRMACGSIKPLADGNPNMMLFSPNDHRLPRMLIPVADCPSDFRQRPQDYQKTLFIAKIAEWKESSMMAHGNVIRSLGEAGEIEPEHEGLLIEHGFDSSDFPPEVVACLPEVDPGNVYVIPDSEAQARNAAGFDFRSECVFTIDPATARDLDDALHCKSLGNGIFEIGVHIADVSYFVEKGNALDKVAGDRATSVYMVHRMIPMLPRLLCEQLCSLQPGTDRLSFSVVWRITEDGHIIDEKFGSSIIRSCAKLSYEHAQGFLDDPEKSWEVEELPEILDGWTVADLVPKTLNLQRVASNLRRKRFDNGALRLDQVKLAYTLHPETRMPIGYKVYEHNDSHRLIEEFMLLANMAVAHRLNAMYPEKAVLRRHPPPQENLMEALERFCESLQVQVDISSSGSLQSSLQSLIGGDSFAAARLQVLTAMFSRPMQLAEYFCAGAVADEADYHHYALNVPLYTHFTSPIRRYPDVLVHRMLKASLEGLQGSDEALGSVEALSSSAHRCNIMKAAAKKVSEASSEIFFSLYVKQCGPIDETAMVMGVLDKSFDIFVMRSGITKRVYCERLNLKSYKLMKLKGKPPYLQLIWCSTEKEEQNDSDVSKEPIKQNLHIFSLVTVQLTSDNEPLKYSAILLHPDSV